MTTDRLVAALAGVLFEVRRRDETHFERRPLALPDGFDGELLRAVAAAAGVSVREATGDWPADAVGELLRIELRRSGETRVELGRVPELVQPLRAAYEALRAPRFDELPGLERRASQDGRTHWLRCGDGRVALLLVNAFGLTLDVWHELARRVAPFVRVLALDAGPPGGPDPYYGAPDAPARFACAVQDVLDGEALSACHVASWCGGAKYALSLAHAMPMAVSSVTLFAPSFAGEAGGVDSAFESSLATMCQVVTRMPAAATGMARSMQALLARGTPGGDADDAALFALHDRVTSPWLHAPFEDATRMQAYSRQLLAFRAHAVAGSPHGAMPLMLVTGEQDATTNNRRARDLLAGRDAIVDLDLRHAGHYFIHQNAALAADLLLSFLRDGLAVEAPHPRLVRRAAVKVEEDALVSGEL